MLLLWGIYREKNTLLTPCLFPSPRWASHLVQVKIEMEAKMSRLVRASGCGIGIESTWVLWWHPATHQGNVPQCHKSKSMTNSTCEVWWTRKKKHLFVCSCSSSHLTIYHEWFIKSTDNVRGSIHQSLSWKFSLEGTEQAYLELGNCVILLKPTNVQITPQMFHGVVRKVHTLTTIISGNILFF